MTLEAINVHHGYGNETVFEGVSLTVTPGEVVGIIGPSGVGKSTLLRLLALFDAPNQGSISYENEDVWQVSEQQRLEYRRQIGMVFQEASLFDASARRNAEYGLRVRQSWTDRLRHELSSLVGKTNGTGDAIEALDTVGLREKVDQDASSLSGGEAQRVAFARALAYEPDILLLDEPTSDLDPRNTAVIEDAVLEAKKRGIGVVIATHDMHQAERIADRVAVLLENDIIEVGDTETVFENPTDERTQKFIDGELIY
ncbi:phosphate ABC transporter ATP-binding protein [Natrarchaeobius halalkaliphilus]|uniref:Phosphate ABC transporter ATP-binding protein n=1 Tax=Natrarchaeobius halalkaliphilus TaxID=1679091 RepID=A0A3N6LJW8_9EURY|nr:phosphate ABC transporter ATP-binding protein [Natrarchaeobius halalkaliphilus]RQG88868.1 phosphate ABC transporter ATP-binding protein [Natrarchaeobius halalkaliphilus]